MAYDDTTVGTLYDNIETSIWMAEAHTRSGDRVAASECLLSAWNLYVRFGAVLSVYAGHGLRDRLVQALACSDAALTAEPMAVAA